MWGDEGEYYGTPRTPDPNANGVDSANGGEFRSAVETALYNFSANYGSAGEQGRSKQMGAAELLAFAHLQALVRQGVLAVSRDGSLVGALGSMTHVDHEVDYVRTLDIVISTRLGTRSQENQGGQAVFDTLTSMSSVVSIVSGFSCLVTGVGCVVFTVAGVFGFASTTGGAVMTCQGTGQGSQACMGAASSFMASAATLPMSGAGGVAGAIGIGTFGTTIGFAQADTPESLRITREYRF